MCNVENSIQTIDVFKKILKILLLNKNNTRENINSGGSHIFLARLFYGQTLLNR